VLRVLEGGAEAPAGVAMIHTIIGISFIAGLVASAIFAVMLDAARRQRERAVDEYTSTVREFLDELKTDAAVASVGDFPYAGADLLGMLERHDLITRPEIDRLIADARSRLPDDEPGPYVPARNGHAGQPLDDEIPF
jgi:hypothetical protein